MFNRQMAASALLLFALWGCGQSPNSAARLASTDAAAEFAALGKPPFAWPDEITANGQPIARSVAVMSFDWPPSAPVGVTRKFKSTQWATGIEPSTATEAYSYTLVAEPVAEGLRIVASNVEADLHGSNVTDRVRDAVNKSIGELSAVIFPTYIVSDEGRYLRLENPEQVRADAKALLEVARMNGAFGAAGSISPELTDEMLKDENLASATMFEWNAMVGAWTGTTFTSGEAAPLRLSNVGGKSGPGDVAPLSGAARLVGHVRCSEAAADDSCVALELRLQGDPAYLKEKTGTVLRNIAKPDVLKNVSIGVDSVSMDLAVRLVTEPGSLRPYHLQIVSRTRLTMTMLDSIKVPSRHEEELLLRFHYPEP